MTEVYLPRDIAPTWRVLPIIDATFSSASNQRYTIEGVEAVPEPATLLLLGAGGLATGLRRWRRRNQ